MARPPSHDPVGDARFWAPYERLASTYSAHFRFRAAVGRETAEFDLPRPSGVQGVPAANLVHLLTRHLIAIDVHGVAGEVRWLGPRLRAALPMDYWPDILPDGVRIACRVPPLDLKRPFPDQEADVRHAMLGLWRLSNWWRSNQPRWAEWRRRDMAGRVEVRPIEGRETWPLRQAVLRPHQSVDEMFFPGDDDPETIHLGGFVDGKLSGVVSVYRAAMPAADKAPEYTVPEAGHGPAVWQFRGMATEPTLRGSGLGRRLWTRCAAHAASRGGRVLWCNARLTAAQFYLKQGMRVVSGVFTPPGIGPHVVMMTELEPGRFPESAESPCEQPEPRAGENQPG